MALNIFTLIDLSLLALFIIFFSIFLYAKRQNLKREGLLYLYRTTWGMKLINAIGKKYKKILRRLSYVTIVSGYALMIGMIYLTYNLIKIYFFSPGVVRAIKVPPITPLVPYLPQVFKLEFLPPFYFSYWIIIIALIAVTHEMAHGIFMRRYNIKIKSTGFAFFPRFLPVFPAAFVEQDEKSMVKAGKFEQMAVLSAGTFANVLTAGVVLVLLIGFSSLAFVPSGIIYDNYAYGIVDIGSITSVNGVNVKGLTTAQLGGMIVSGKTNEIEAGNEDFLGLAGFTSDPEKVALYISAPAIKENLSSIITGINGVEVSGIKDLVTELSKYSPGEEIIVKTIANGGEVNKTITLEEHPNKPSKAWLGISFTTQKGGNFIRRIIDVMSTRDPHVYYKPKFNGLSVFIYNLLWWLVLISMSVALINMLPVGIFDGGRFFYLTVLGLTKKEKIAQRAYAVSTYIFLLILIMLLIFWVFSFLR